MALKNNPFLKFVIRIMNENNNKDDDYLILYIYYFISMNTLLDGTKIEELASQIKYMLIFCHYRTILHQHNLALWPRSLLLFGSSIIE